MVYCKVTAAVCKQCNAVNFLGCREHRELLTRVYAKDEVHTTCSHKKCTTNSYASKFPCVSCKGTVYDVYRLTVSKNEVDGTVGAFHKRAGGKAITGMRMDSSLLACMECSCLVFPVIGKRLCVLDPGSGQLLDGDDQPIDLMNWKAKLPHCKKRCPGTGNGPFARIDVRLDFGELEFLQDMLKNEGDGKWKEFFFEGKYGYEKRAFIPLSPPTEPFKGGPLYSPEVPSARIHPIAIGICKCCSYVTFAHCIRHSMLLTKAHVQEDPLSVVVSCATPGCQTESTGKGLSVKCRTRRGGDIDWLHLLISKSEAAYLKKAWYGRGLHYHSSLTFSTRMLICRQCKSVSFPGVEGRLCELTKAGLLTVERRDDTGISVRNYKYSHTHVAGCSNLGSYDGLASRDITLVGDEIDYLHRFLPNSATGSWSEEVLRIRDIVSKKPSGSSSRTGDWNDIDAPPQLDADSTRVAPLGSSASQTRNNGPPQPLPMTGGAPAPYPTGMPPPGTILIDPTTGAPVMVGAYPGQLTYMSPPPQSIGHHQPPPLSMAPMTGMPPQPQLYPTLPYGSMPIQNQAPADYNPFAAGGGGPAYATMPPPGSDGYPTAAFGSMSLGSSSSGVVGGGGGSPLFHQTIPSHNPAFAPPPQQHQQQSPASAPYATMRPQPPPKPQGWSTGTVRPSTGQPPQ